LGRFVSPLGILVGDIINLVDYTSSGRQKYQAMTFDGENILILWQDARRGVTIPESCDNTVQLTSILTDVYGQFVSKSGYSIPGGKMG